MSAANKRVSIPNSGEAISLSGGSLVVPDHPIIPYIEGDGIGVDITPAMLKVVDKAVEIAYRGQRKIIWVEAYAGEKALGVYGKDAWLPDETLDLIRQFAVAIKGPLTTPVSGGIRSLNVALRQRLDLYMCHRPIRYFEGTPSPMQHPETVSMDIFRENSEDIYAGIEFEAGSAEADALIALLQNQYHVDAIRFPERCSLGIKVISEQGSKRLIRRAISTLLIIITIR